MLHRVAALLVAIGFVLAGPAVAGPARSVSAHAQLVSSSPGSGEALDTAPAELRLVFSEPLESAFTSVDIAAASGEVVLARAGTPDPADPRVLVASLPSLADGSYTVTWRTLSAADGHTAEGFFTFGVGASGVIGGGHGHDGGAAGGHGHLDDPAVRLVEVAARFAAFGGLMFAFGIALVALLLRGVAPRLPGLAADGAWILLLAAAAGSTVMLVLAAAALSEGLDIAGYATGVRAGELLAARIAITLAGGAAAFALSMTGRPLGALVVAVVAGLSGMATIALGGHAAAFASPVPILVDIVHLGSAATWASGVVVIAVVAVTALRRSRSDDDLRGVVARYSAVALVSVALVGLTGTYLAWISLGSPDELASDYGVALALKLAAFAVALALGALAYLDGGRERLGPRSFALRVGAESGIALLVVLLAANLTVVSPPGPTRPIAIASVVGSRDAGAASFALQPGRPGPNGFVVELRDVAVERRVVELVLQRLDEGAGEARIRLPLSADGTRFGADGGLLPGDSEWDAAVVASDAGGTEVSRTRFRFSLDGDGVSAGRELPPIDPRMVVGMLLVGLAAVGITFTLAGGRLPRTDALASRIAVLGGGTVGALLGAAILVGGG